MAFSGTAARLSNVLPIIDLLLPRKKSPFFQVLTFCGLCWLFESSISARKAYDDHKKKSAANGRGIEACKCPVINDGQPQKSPNGKSWALLLPQWRDPFHFSAKTFRNFRGRGNDRSPCEIMVCSSSYIITHAASRFGRQVALQTAKQVALRRWRPLYAEIGSLVHCSSLYPPFWVCAVNKSEA